MAMVRGASTARSPSIRTSIPSTTRKTTETAGSIPSNTRCNVGDSFGLLEKERSRLSAPFLLSYGAAEPLPVPHRKVKNSLEDGHNGDTRLDRGWSRRWSSCFPRHGWHRIWDHR